MTDKPGPTRKTMLFAIGFAVLLQLLVMLFLATDRITSGTAVSMLSIVLIFGLLPAMAFIKSRP